MKKKSKIAFTLAEVLITLTIIGVVAAITVPVLTLRYQKDETLTKLKKAYSVISQTTAMAEADNGNIDEWEIGPSLKGESSAAFMEKYIKPYVSSMNDIEISGIWAKMYLNDGTLISGALVNYTDNQRLQVNIDINGAKGPNKQGRDIFEYNYYLNYKEKDMDTAVKGRLLPYGYWCTREELISDKQNMCHKNQSKAGCAALIMKDGWQIKDDYPW